MNRPVPIRKELLLTFGALFGGAALIAAAGLAVLVPLLNGPPGAIPLVLILVGADFAAIFLIGTALLRQKLVGPMEALSRDARRIADGDYEHRIQASASAEIQEVRESVKAMAERLLADQALLAENIESLERTNQELIEARDQILQTARLASVGTLAAGIAHEVGNPLGAIMGYVDVAARRLEKAGQDTELLDAIREEARRIDRIVRGLLDYARPQGGQPDPVPPAEVLERVRVLLENQGAVAGVDNDWVYEQDVEAVVLEPHQLEQVLVNLLLNAVHAVRQAADPWIRVTLSMDTGEVASMPVKREEDPPGINYLHRRRVSRDDGGRGVDPLFTARHVVVIVVEDNGPGIVPEDLQRIFDPFFTTKEPGEGTGLGLSICARLVEGMGGRISAANRPEGGARFEIRLPAWREQLAVAPGFETREGT